MQTDPVFTAGDLPEDRGLDLALRPQSFGDFVGQHRLIDNLKIYAPSGSEETGSCDPTVVVVPLLD